MQKMQERFSALRRLKRLLLVLYYRPSMALCVSCIDLQGGRKCSKIVWSNRGRHFPVV
jgi:hypothetical protein